MNTKVCAAFVAYYCDVAEMSNIWPFLVLCRICIFDVHLFIPSSFHLLHCKVFLDLRFEFEYEKMIQIWNKTHPGSL